MYLYTYRLITCSNLLTRKYVTNSIKIFRYIERNIYFNKSSIMSIMYMFCCKTELQIFNNLQEELHIDGNDTSWRTQLQFISYCIASGVGLGNDMWRFPFVAYKNGGGAFLIPYLILLVIIGGPLFFMETFLGQFSSSNCVKMWDMVPALRGKYLENVQHYTF